MNSFKKIKSSLSLLLGGGERGGELNSKNRTQEKADTSYSATTVD